MPKMEAPAVGSRAASGLHPSGQLERPEDRASPQNSQARVNGGPSEVASRFLDRLAPDGDLTFQTFDDGPDERPELARILHGSLDQHADDLVVLNRERAGVFVMINAGDGRGRRAENVVSIRALFLDLDGPPLHPVLAAGAPAHLVVESSPGKFHVYWLVSDCPLDRFSILQKALAARFNGDPQVHDRPRVMRVVDFWHRKGKPFRTRLIADRADLAIYNTDELVGRLDLRKFLEPAKLPAPARPLKLSETTPVYFHAALERAAHAIATAPNGRQNHTLNREAFGIGQFVAAGSIPESTARRVLTDAAAGMVDYDPSHPWSTAQIESMIDRAFIDALQSPRGFPR